MGDDGRTDKIKGKAKETVGKVTGDKKLEAEGETDQAKGKAKEAAREARERAEGVRESLKPDDD